MSESESRISDLEESIVALLGFSTMRSRELVVKLGHSQLEVQDALWHLNSLGKVRVTPDSRWELVRDA